MKGRCSCALTPSAERMKMNGVYVQDIIDDVYKSFGVDATNRGSNSDSDSCNYLEHHAKRKAHRSLEGQERRQFDRIVKACEKNMKLGYDASLSVLFRLGVFLSACARGRKCANSGEKQMSFS